MAPERNQQCPCGLPKKYKHCCMFLDEGRPKRIELAHGANSLLDKNLALLVAVNDIFKLDQPWDKVKVSMSDARIKEFYQFVAGIWPPDTDYKRLLPKPDSTLRALYLGENDPGKMLENVFRFSLYADQIILVNPFDNPHCLADKYNPVLHPGEWRVQTLRLIYHLRILMPWIASGLVLLIPDPGDFNYQLRMKTIGLASKRLNERSFTPEELEASSAHSTMEGLFYLSPDHYLADKAREVNPEMSDDDMKDMLDFVAMRRREDPLLPNDTLDNMPGQFTAYRSGANLEMGLFLCQTMGAFPYTNIPFRWREILASGDQLGPDAQVWSPLTNAFSTLNFKFLNNVDSKFAVTMRQEGRLESFRSYMRKIWGTVGGELDVNKADTLARDFRDELTDEYAKAQAEWSGIDRDLVKWALPAIGGVLGTAAGMVTGHYGLAVPSAGFVGKGVNELLQAHLKRKEFRKKTPLSVFIDLDRA